MLSTAILPRVCKGRDSDTTWREAPASSSTQKTRRASFPKAEISGTIDVNPPGNGLPFFTSHN
jgi:hypothetical protein